jgi:hypothetical protein
MKTSIRRYGFGLAAVVVACSALGVATGAVHLPGGQRASQSAAQAAAVHYQPIRWAKLMPEVWLKRFRELDYGQMNDGDPRVTELLHEVETTWDTAPTVAELDGINVKLPGYIVPLEEVKGDLTEFLLVPYLGACIHTPPPPANQIVHVKSSTPLKGLHSMDIVSISGMLKVSTVSSSMGVSGYAMDATLVERYVAPAPHAESKGGTARTASEASKTDKS